MASEQQWRLTTDEYRKALCVKVDAINFKIDDIYKRIYELPCKARSSLYESLDNKIKLIWGILITMIAAIITTFFRRQ